VSTESSTPENKLTAVLVFLQDYPGLTESLKCCLTSHNIRIIIKLTSAHATMSQSYL